MATVKYRHPRLRNTQLSLADGLVTIDEEGFFEAKSEAQKAKAELMNWQKIPKKRGRRKKSEE